MMAWLQSFLASVGAEAQHLAPSAATRPPLWKLVRKSRMASSRIGKARCTRERSRIRCRREHERPLDEHSLAGGYVSRRKHAQLPIKRARGDAARKLVALEGHVGRVGKAIHIARGGGGSRPERRSKLQPVRTPGAAEARCVHGLLLGFRISGHALLVADHVLRHTDGGKPTGRSCACARPHKEAQDKSRRSSQDMYRTVLYMFDLRLT